MSSFLVTVARVNVGRISIQDHDKARQDNGLPQSSLNRTAFRRGLGLLLWGGILSCRRFVVFAGFYRLPRPPGHFPGDR